MQELRSVTETAELSGHTRSQAQRTQRSQALRIPNLPGSIPISLRDSNLSV